MWQRIEHLSPRNVGGDKATKKRVLTSVVRSSQDSFCQFMR